MEKILQKRSWHHHTIDFEVNLTQSLPLETLLYSSPWSSGYQPLINLFIPARTLIYHSCCKLPGTGRAGFRHSVISNVTKAIQIVILLKGLAYHKLLKPGYPTLFRDDLSQTSLFEFATALTSQPHHPGGAKSETDLMDQ